MESVTKFRTLGVAVGVEGGKGNRRVVLPAPKDGGVTVVLDGKPTRLIFSEGMLSILRESDGSFRAKVTDGTFRTFKHDLVDVLMNHVEYGKNFEIESRDVPIEKEEEQLFIETTIPLLDKPKRGGWRGKKK